jgi:hypothetical protein
MVLVRTQALFWGRRKKTEKNPSPPLICEIKRTITNFCFSCGLMMMDQAYGKSVTQQPQNRLNPVQPVSKTKAMEEQ